MEGALNRALFFIGWVLSPFTGWNDAFVNIPLSYLAASLAVRFARMDFAVAVTAAYWLTNIAGLLLMYLSGRKIFAEKKIVPEAIKLVLTVVLYSAILILTARIGFLKPLKV